MVLSLPCTSLCWHQGKLLLRLSVARAAFFVGSPVSLQAAFDCCGWRCYCDRNQWLGILWSPVHLSQQWEFLWRTGGIRESFVSNMVGTLRCWRWRFRIVLLAQRRAICAEPGLGEHCKKWVGSQLQTVLTSESLRGRLAILSRAGCLWPRKRWSIFWIIALNRRKQTHFVLQSSWVLETCCGWTSPNRGPNLLIWPVCTESGIIYVVEWHQRKLLAFHPGSTTYAEVLRCPRGLHPVALLLQDRSLYVSMVEETSGEDSNRPGAVYQYLLPPDLQLEWNQSRSSQVQRWSWWGMGLTSFSLATLITEFQISSVFHPSLYDAPKYLDLLKVLLFPVGKSTIWNSGGTLFSNPSNSQNI